MTENGDTSPSLAESDLENFVVGESIETTPPHDIQTLAKTLETIIDGASPEDATVLRDALLRETPPMVKQSQNVPDEQFMRQVPDFERKLVRSGIRLIEFWFSVSRKEQRRRFKEREAHPLKQWKLSPVDLASLDKCDEYTSGKEGMFFYSDTYNAPWTVVKSDCKKRARLNAMRFVSSSLPYSGKDRGRIGKIDPLLDGRANVLMQQPAQTSD